MSKPKLVIEFSLALNNRTGKYFAGLDLISTCPDRLQSLAFWRLQQPQVPHGIFARVLGRCLSYEIKARSTSAIFDRLVPELRPRGPVLFTDPREVLLYDVQAHDAVIVHDLGPITHPQYYAAGVEEIYSRVFRKILRGKPHLIFVSRRVQEEFIAAYGGDYASLRVIYNPTRTTIVSQEVIRPAGVSKPFFLTVGAIGTRKNQRGLVQAFNKAGLARNGYQLVIVGGPEPGYDDVVEEVVKTPGVLMPGYARDAELGWLYANAIGFVLPSHLEGFGMPVAEALAHDLLPMVSNFGPLAEVAGEFAVQVDPSSEDSIADGLQELASMPPEERADRISRAKLGLSRFEPEVIAAEWVKAINEILN